MVILASALLSWTVATSVTAYLAAPGARLRWLDQPNARSLHETPVPRTGGIGILAGSMAGWSVVGLNLGMPASAGWVGLALALVVLVSLLDDWRGVGVVQRLGAHMAAAAALLHAGLLPGFLHIAGWQWLWPWWLAAPLTLLFVVWMINLYNFMDGMDGFAAGMASVGFAVMALLGWQAGNDLFAAMNLCVALAAAGFLWHNFPPARIFMGDTGSSALGLLVAAAILWAQRDGVFPFWIGLLVFSPFIVDATATLVIRALKGERVWLPHRDHAYQRLVRMGWGHRRVVLLAYGLMLLTGTSAIALGSVGPTMQSVALGLWAVFYVIIALSIRRLGRGRGGGF